MLLRNALLVNTDTNTDELSYNVLRVIIKTFLEPNNAPFIEYDVTPRRNAMTK